MITCFGRAHFVTLSLLHCAITVVPSGCAFAAPVPDDPVVSVETQGYWRARVARLITAGPLRELLALRAYCREKTGRACDTTFTTAKNKAQNARGSGVFSSQWALDPMLKPHKDNVDRMEDPTLVNWLASQVSNEESFGCLERSLGEFAKLMNLRGGRYKDFLFAKLQVPQLYFRFLDNSKHGAMLKDGKCLDAEIGFGLRVYDVQADPIEYLMHFNCLGQCRMMTAEQMAAGLEKYVRPLEDPNSALPKGHGPADAKVSGHRGLRKDRSGADPGGSGGVAKSGSGKGD